MKVRVATASGSIYILDAVAMTWERVNKKPILDFEGSSGKLAVWPDISVGFSMQFIDFNPSDSFQTPIYTTQVVRVELIS
jgi:hypothetical protein